MAEDYARACGVPREVVIGGRAFLVGKLTPRDIGTLQAWFKTIVDNPRVEARERLRNEPNLSDDETRAIWVDAATRALDWPPGLGSDIGSLLLDTEEGCARFLWVVLRKHQPTVSLDAARQLFSEISVDAYAEVIQLAMPGELGDVMQPNDDSSSTTYGEVRATLCERYKWTFDVVDNMNFELIQSALNLGKPSVGIEITDAAQAQEVSANWRKYVRGL